MNYSSVTKEKEIRIDKVLFQFLVPTKTIGSHGKLSGIIPTRQNENVNRVSNCSIVRSGTEMVIGVDCKIALTMIFSLGKLTVAFKK